MGEALSVLKFDLIRLLATIRWTRYSIMEKQEEASLFKKHNVQSFSAADLAAALQTGMMCQCRQCKHMNDQKEQRLQKSEEESQRKIGEDMVQALGAVFKQDSWR